MVIPHYMGRSEEMNGQKEQQTVVDEKDIKKFNSFCSRSLCQDIPLLLPQEPDKMKLARGNVEPLSFRKVKVEHSAPALQLKAFVDDPGLPQLSREALFDVTSKPSMQKANKDWWEAQQRSSRISIDEIGQVGPRTPCHCQVSVLFFELRYNFSP